MKLINSYTGNRSLLMHNRRTLSYIDVEEYATFWKVWVRPYTYALAITDGWKYKKREYKTPEEAVNKCISELEERYK